MSNHAGGFATIDPRHAGDTPQSSAYGSNSPQATNENKPHHHNKHTKTSRTRPTQPPKEHTTPALPSNHSGDFATIDHRHADDTPQSSAYGSNSPKPPTKTSHTTTTNRRRHAEHDQHSHLKDPPTHRRATTPPSTQPPHHTATQAPTVGSIIPAARTEARRTQHAAAQKTPHHEPPRPNRRPLHPKHPMSPRFHRDGLHFEQALGGFCDHRPPTRRRHAATQRLW